MWAKKAEPIFGTPRRTGTWCARTYSSPYRVMLYSSSTAPKEGCFLPVAVKPSAS